MTVFRNFLPLTLTILLPLFFQPAHAQEEGENPENPEENWSKFHFAVYVWPVQGILTENSEVAGVPRIYYQSPEGVRRVPTGRNVTSPLMFYHGPMPLELFDGRRVEVPPPEDAPPGTPPTQTFEKRTLAELEIPENWKQAMLILFPGQEDENGQLRILPIRYDLDVVRPDHVRIHNTTDVPMVLKAEDQEHPLPANGVLDFEPRNDGGHHAFRASFYSLSERGTTRLRYTTRIAIREGQNSLYLLYKKDSRRFRLQRIGGHEPPPTPTPVPEPESGRRRRR